MGCTLAMPCGFADKRRDLGAQCASHPSRTHTLTHLRPKHLVSAPSFSWSSWREALSWVLQKTWHAFQYFSHVPSWTPPVRTVNNEKSVGFGGAAAAAESLVDRFFVFSQVGFAEGWRVLLVGAAAHTFCGRRRQSRQRVLYLRSKTPSSLFLKTETHSSHLHLWGGGGSNTDD